MESINFCPWPGPHPPHLFRSSESGFLFFFLEYAKKYTTTRKLSEQPNTHVEKIILRRDL